MVRVLIVEDDPAEAVLEINRLRLAGPPCKSESVTTEADVLEKLPTRSAPTRGMAAALMEMGRAGHPTYLGQTVRATNARTYTETVVHDVVQRIRQVADPAPGGTTQYGYGAFGDIVQIVDPNRCDLKHCIHSPRECDPNDRR
jgi:hypothetical protein